MKKNINTEEYWDKTYKEDLEKFPNIEDSYRYDIPRFTVVSKFVTGKTLDVGCGMGHYERFCFKTGIPDVTGCDWSKFAINYAMVNVPTKFKHWGIDNIVGKFDTILLQEVIEHTDNPTAVVKKLIEHLMEDGRMVITTPEYSGIMHSSEHMFEYTESEFSEFMKNIFPKFIITKCTCVFGICMIGVGYGF